MSGAVPGTGQNCFQMSQLIPLDSHPIGFAQNDVENHPTGLSSTSLLKITTGGRFQCETGSFAVAFSLQVVSFSTSFCRVFCPSWAAGHWSEWSATTMFKRMQVQCISCAIVEVKQDVNIRHIIWYIVIWYIYMNYICICTVWKRTYIYIYDYILSGSVWSQAKCVMICLHEPCGCPKQSSTVLTFWTVMKWVHEMFWTVSALINEGQPFKNRTTSWHSIYGQIYIQDYSVFLWNVYIYIYSHI